MHAAGRRHGMRRSAAAFRDAVRVDGTTGALSHRSGGVASASDAWIAREVFLLEPHRLDTLEVRLQVVEPPREAEAALDAGTGDKRIAGVCQSLTVAPCWCVGTTGLPRAEWPDFKGLLRLSVLDLRPVLQPPHSELLTGGRPPPCTTRRLLRQGPFQSLLIPRPPSCRHEELGSRITGPSRPWAPRPHPLGRSWPSSDSR